MTESSYFNYEELKKRQIEDSISTQIYGVPIVLSDFVCAIQPNQNLIPIWGCVCVQDSTDNPCPCRWIVWLHKDSIMQSGKTKFKNSEGHELHFFKVSNRSDVVIEKLESIGVREYAKIIETAD